MPHIVQCPQCHWVGATRARNTGILAYLAFLVIMFVLGYFALRWVVQYQNKISNRPAFLLLERWI
jgi:hypothetical protein